jgi:hypothetical protein
MSFRVLPEARGDLREAIRHYRAVKPPAIGKRLAARVLDSFNQAIASVEAMPLSRPVHSDIAGARWVQLERFPPRFDLSLECRVDPAVIGVQSDRRFAGAPGRIAETAVRTVARGHYLGAGPPSRSMSASSTAFSTFARSL